MVESALAINIANDFQANSPILAELREEHSYQQARRDKERAIRSALSMCRRHIFIWSERPGASDDFTRNQMQKTLKVVNDALDWQG